MLPISDIFEEMYEAESKLKETLEDADSLILIDEITRGTTELEQLITFAQRIFKEINNAFYFNE